MLTVHLNRAWVGPGAHQMRARAWPGRGLGMAWGERQAGAGWRQGRAGRVHERSAWCGARASGRSLGIDRVPGAVGAVAEARGRLR